ncbi:MAG TPA: putative inorganic carbon transporter subunit DabA, partial [Pyrinomonadaceae bacterium]
MGRINAIPLTRSFVAPTGGISDIAADSQVRPQAQAVFCIDVRSEPLRRNLEATGDYETFGFAGFFAVAIRHQALGSHHETDQFPVILKSKNYVREIPRTYHGQFIVRHRRRAKLLEAFHALLYDLKENVVTPYVMVESLGWFYSLPMVGKNICATRYRTAMDWMRRKLVPPVATTLTVDKLSRQEVEEMLAAEQRATTRRALQEKFGERNLNLSLERLEFLRRRALEDEDLGEPSPQARSTALTAQEEAEFVVDLRQRYDINRGAAFARLERITRTGFTLNEQVYTVETVLRMIGLTTNFARLVLFCGHASSSENNPFEAALDCGACGGNSGRPNARVLAIMANKPLVREQLAKNGIAIPQDTYFIAGQHNTTTDEVELVDLEDLPPTHRKDLLQLMRDLERAGARNSQERCTRFPEIDSPLRASKARREVRRRSSDWSQVRPEWGLSGNAAMIIGRRGLTRGIQLDGRVFLHSYDYRGDPEGKLLEAVMTGPQIVAQWINMEHYFSTVDQEIYGS